MNTLHVEGWFQPNRTYVLTTAITVFEVSSSRLSVERFGRVCELPEGADLEICGDGFNEHSTRARYRGGDYFVFWRDLALAVSPQTLSRRDDKATSFRPAAVSEG
jgi:hypothetical protein